MLVKIISALALTLLLTGGASAFIPQPQGSLQTFAAEHAQQEQSLQTELFAAEPHNIYAGHTNSVEPSAVSEMFADVAEPHNIYAGHSNNVQPQEMQTQLFAANTAPSDPQPHNIYAGHSNGVQAQESLETQLFAANTLSEPRQFD